MQLLRKLLWPVSFLYGVGVYLRNLTYDLGLISSHKFKTPTICVGNLSLGGTGKTPMIEWLIRNLSENSSLAVLSRGYGRKSSGFILADSQSNARQIGDEPLQIYNKFPDIRMAVDANRRRGIAELEREYHPDMILLDDAFQHRKITPCFSILLTTYGNLYSSDWFLPTGNLRDAKSQAKRAEMIIVTKCPPSIGTAEMESIKREIRPQGSQELLFCSLQYSDMILGPWEDLSVSQLRDREITVVTGIANPGPFIKHLEHEGLKIRHMEFGDHHDFTENELSKLKDEELIITTEKDYVRSLNQLVNAGYIEVQHRFLRGGDQKLLNAINKLEC